MKPHSTFHAWVPPLPLLMLLRGRNGAWHTLPGVFATPSAARFMPIFVTECRDETGRAHNTVEFSLS